MNYGQTQALAMDLGSLALEIIFLILKPRNKCLTKIQ